MAGKSGSSRVRGEALDILCNSQTNRKARPLLEALQRGAEAAGFDARLVDHPQVRPLAWLFVYGLGGVDRVHYANRHKLVAFDLAYWDRKGPGRKYRVAVGGFHSPGLIFRGMYPGPMRWQAAAMPIVPAGGDPRGPILLVGNGPKSTAVGAAGWAAEKSRKLRQMFPDRKVWHRPKPGRMAEEGVLCDAVVTEEPIDEVLARVSLVVCRHSNVAVDACRLGVPVVCDDGAAASIYPCRFDGEQPSLEKRTEFLHRLAWWQWSPAECETALFWDWIRGEMRAD